MPFNRSNHNILGVIRPRFTLKIEVDPEIAIKHIKENIKKDKTISSLRTNHTKEYVFLNIPSWEQHYWSPEMTVRIEKGEFSGKVFANCLIGPRQSVWAMFTLIYTALSILTLFGGIFGMVQLQTSGKSLFIWTLPIGFLLWATVFLTSKIGQKKGRDQMLHLVSFLYHSLSEISTVERVEK